MPNPLKLVVAIEGIDGAGKSSLARHIETLCARHDRQCMRIRRRSAGAIGQLTQVLREQASTLTPQADIFLRIARAYQQAQWAAQATASVVVLNRFALSIFAAARAYGLDPSRFLPLLKNLVQSADVQATILVTCPLEIAWSRVTRRNSGSSPIRTVTEKRLRRMARSLQKGFRHPLLTGQRWLVDNSKTPHESQQQLADYLVPYLTQRQPTAQPAAWSSSPLGWAGALSSLFDLSIATG
jgi:thymidylate kinase